MGATGFLYESIKDELKWAGLRKKYYVNFLSSIGTLKVLTDEEYAKRKVEDVNMETEHLVNTLINVFGSGE